MLRTIKNILKFIKEWLIMTFRPNSAIVRSYVILILAEKMVYEEVPKLFNLREAVQEALEI